MDSKPPTWLTTRCAGVLAHISCLPGRYGIGTGDEIFVETNRGRVRMKARVDGRVAEGVVLVPHGWSGEANANLLTDTQCREPIMGYPEVKSLLCRVRKA